MKLKIITITIILANFIVIFTNNNAIVNAETINLSLKNCINRAANYNINVKTAQIEKEKTQSIIDETYSALYPKINIGASLVDNLKLAVIMLPGELAGKPGTMMPVTMGSQFNANAAATLNWILYNQTALSALKLSKKVAEVNDLGIAKAQEQLAFEVSKLYFMTLTTAEQRNILEENVERTTKLRDITKVLVDNGMALQVDYQRVNISIENLLTQLNNVEAGLEQQINTLKYILNVPITDEIVLIDSTNLVLLAEEPATVSDFSDHIDIKLLESQKEINRLSKKITNSGYFPTLALQGQYAYQGQRNEFANYFNDAQENIWYNSAAVTLSLSIPIFDGFEKRSKAQQNELDFLKTEALIIDKKANFDVEFRVAMNNYNNSKVNLERQRQNIELAEKVYDETTLKYREGMASMSNLLQDEMSLSSAQANFLNALYSFKESELKIMSLNGELAKLLTVEE